MPRHGGGNPESYDISHFPGQDNPGPLDPFSIQSSIQKYILEITNNGRTLITVLTGIYRASADREDCPEPRRKVKHSLRVRVGRLLLDRVLGTYPELALSPVQIDSLTDAESGVDAGDGERYIDPEALAKARAEIQRMKDEGILTPYTDGRPRRRIIVPEIPEDFDVTPYKEEAASFWADMELRLERQKQWPEIEERRRKKLAKIYPSHSDGDPPDT